MKRARWGNFSVFISFLFKVFAKIVFLGTDYTDYTVFLVDVLEILRFALDDTVSYEL